MDAEIREKDEECRWRGVHEGIWRRMDGNLTEERRNPY